jgi:hypothetical protein
MEDDISMRRMSKLDAEWIVANSDRASDADLDAAGRYYLSQIRRELTVIERDLAQEIAAGDVDVAAYRATAAIADTVVDLYAVLFWRRFEDERTELRERCVRLDRLTMRGVGHA